MEAVQQQHQQHQQYSDMDIQTLIQQGVGICEPPPLSPEQEARAREGDAQWERAWALEDEKRRQAPARAPERATVSPALPIEPSPAPEVSKFVAAR